MNASVLELAFTVIHSCLQDRLIYVDMCSIYDIQKYAKINTPTLRFTDTFQTKKVLKIISKLSLSTK